MKHYFRSLFSPYYNREIAAANRTVTLLVLVWLTLIVIAVRV